MTNSFKAALADGQRQTGLWLGLADAYCAEICAGAGFDWLLIDGEHGPNDLRTILAQLQAVAPTPSHPVVRPVDGDPAKIKQLLDIGARSLLIPMVDTAEQASALVRATRYPPHGIRGVGTALARAAQWGRDSQYLSTANDDVCLLVQVESVRGLENLSAIAATDGVDGVFIGPADLAASMGHLGNPGHPEVVSTIEGALKTIVAHGKAPGILAADPKLARHYISLGALFVAVGVDTVLLSRTAASLAAAFKEDLSAPAAPGAAY